jgi:hypothetical protein
MGIAMSVVRHNDFFFGWRVVGAAFVLAVLAWGTGFYGPPIYLQALQENRGWPVGRDNPFRCWCSRRGQSADTPRALWYSQCDKGWCSLFGCWRPRLGQRGRTLATLRGHIVQRRRLGSDGRGCSQRYNLPVVCAHSPCSGWLASAYWAFRSQLQRSALSWHLRGGFSQTGSSRGRLSRWDCGLTMMFSAHL